MTEKDKSMQWLTPSGHEVDIRICEETDEAIVYSKYQHAIFDAVAESDRNFVIEAVAGGGKTSTILEALRRVNPPRRATFVAFNRDIAAELQTRVPPGVKAKTFNGLGHGALMRARDGAVALARSKTFKILNSFPMIPDGVSYEDGVVAGCATAEELDVYGRYIARLVSLAKSIGIGILEPNSPDTWFDLIRHHDIEIAAPDDRFVVDYDRFVHLAQVVLQRSDKWAGEDGIIDFDDQVYLPIKWNLRFWEQDLVFVDEAQDVNAIQRAILKKLLGRGGRLIAVGDSRQAIYGFRGAAAD